MERVEIYFNYRNIWDMIFVGDINFDDDVQPDIYGFEITLDYVSGNHPADQYAELFRAILHDGDYMQDKLLELMLDDDDNVQTLYDAWVDETDDYYFD